MPWARSFLGFQPASTDTKVPAKLFHFMALFLAMLNLSKLSSAHVPAKLLYLVVYLAEGLLHA